MDRKTLESGTGEGERGGERGSVDRGRLGGREEERPEGRGEREGEMCIWCLQKRYGHIPQPDGAASLTPEIFRRVYTVICLPSWRTNALVPLAKICFPCTRSLLSAWGFSKRGCIVPDQQHSKSWLLFTKGLECARNGHMRYINGCLI